MHTKNLSRPQQGTKVLRVLNQVKQKKKWRFGFGLGEGNQIFQGLIWIAAHFKCNPLVVVTNLFQAITIHGLEWNVALANNFQNLVKPAFTAASLGKQQLKCLTALSHQGFVNGVTAGEPFLHFSSSSRKCPLCYLQELLPGP